MTAVQWGTTPKRVRLSRAMARRKPGGGVVVVSAPSKWGNPWTVGDRFEVRYMTRSHGVVGVYDGDADYYCDDGMEQTMTAELAVWLYRQNLVDVLARSPMNSYRDELNSDDMRAALAELRGHDLACWCPLDQPCHADVLIDLANKVSA